MYLFIYVCIYLFIYLFIYPRGGAKPPTHSEGSKPPWGPPVSLREHALEFSLPRISYVPVRCTGTGQRTLWAEHVGGGRALPVLLGGRVVAVDVSVVVRLAVEVIVAVVRDVSVDVSVVVRLSVEVTVTVVRVVAVDVPVDVSVVVRLVVEVTCT